MRKGALWTPEISVRSTSDDSEQEGVVARAKSRAAQILETHQVEPLPDEVSRQLDQIMERARRELVGG